MKHNLLKSIFISLILMMGVGNVWGVDHTGGYIYFLKPSTWTESKVMMFIGHDSYTSVYEMTKVSNTDNLYRYTMPSWNGAKYVAFANAGSVWGTGNWGPSNRTNASHYTNVYNNYGFNSGSYYVIVPANTSNNAGITINYTGTSASTINLTTKAIASNKAHGTVSVSGYYMSAYNTASTRSAVSSSASNATASTTLAPGSTATFKATASTGYEFEGWYDAATGGNQLSTNSTYTFKYDISYTGKTVYARFKAKQYTITYKDQGNVTFTGEHASGYPTKHTYGTATTLKDPSKAGYTFDGWFTDAACTTNKVTSLGATAYTANITLYAKWTENAPSKTTVTFVSNPAGACDLKVDGSAFTSGNTFEVGTSDYVTLTVENQKEGYTWNGFSYETNEINITTNGAYSIKVRSNGTTDATTISVNFIPKQYTITYTLNGGSGTMTPTTYTVETATFNLPTPTKAGSTFEGWYTTSDFSGSKVTQITKGSTGNKTFYAKWTEIKLDHTGGFIYFENSKTNWSEPNVCMFIGEEKLEMVNIEGTLLYYVKLPPISKTSNSIIIKDDKNPSNNFANLIINEAFSDQYTYHLKPQSNKGSINMTKVESWEDLNKELEVSPKVGNAIDNNGGSVQIEAYKLTGHGKSTSVIGIGVATIATTSKVTLTAKPAEGYKFVSWQMNNESTYTQNPLNYNEPYSITIKYAKFEKIAPKGLGWYVIGTFTNNWDDNSKIEFTTDGINDNIGYATIEMNNAKIEEFKIKDTSGNWYGNVGEIKNSIEGWTFTKDYQNCKIEPKNSLDANGNTINKYTFIFDKSTKKLSVVYPEVAGYYIASSNKTLSDNVGEANSIRLTKNADGTYSHTFDNLSSGTYRFKISTGIWKDNGGADWNFDDVDTDCSDKSINLTKNDDTYKNIEFKLNNTINFIVISFDPSTAKICIKRDMGPFYGLKSVDGSKTLYSNYVKNINDIMSVYCAHNGKLTLLKYNDNGSTTEIANSTITYSSANEQGDVIVAPLTSTTTFGPVSVYTGDFYIRTDMAPGGWNSYKQESHAFTNFNKYEDETFNHYWVEYTDNANVKARIANDYNPSLATELGDYNVSNANVRFSYNNETNVFERAFLGGSSNNADFLRLVIDNAGFSTGITFGDISNWVYEVTTQVTKGQIADVRAKHGNVDSGNPYNLRDDVKLLGENSSEGEQTIRVIYDFKKNRMICGWLPGDIDHSGQLVIDADMLVVRVDNGKASEIKMNDEKAAISDLNRLYFVLELTRDEVINNKTNIFWFSLPFECKLKDVFGIEGYGTKWVVQRYRGDKRAELGFRPEIETFWANMKQSNTATLEPNRGYVLSLNLKESDFREIKLDNDQTTKSLLRLYFPSTAENFILSQSDINMTSTVPEHLCKVQSIEDREPLDSHWNVIGIPGYQQVDMKAYTENNQGWVGYEENKAPNFLYEWQGVKDSYKVVDGKTFEYQHFYSYFVQFAGTINWSQYTQNTPNPAAAPRRVAKKADKQYKVVLGENGANVDQTFITLSEKGNHDYSIGNDLEKIGSTSVARIYTQEGNWNLAANHLSDTTTVLPLTLSIPAEGEYTLSLEQGRYSSDALLYDSENGTYTDLSKEGYTFTAEAGVNNERFALRFGMKLPGGNPTDLQQSQAQYLVRTEGQRIIIEGMAGDVRLYDMTGRVMTQQRAENYTEITVPATGVYVLQVGNQFEKMIIK